MNKIVFNKRCVTLISKYLFMHWETFGYYHKERSDGGFNGTFMIKNIRIWNYHTCEEFVILSNGETNVTKNMWSKYSWNSFFTVTWNRWHYSAIFICNLITNFTRLVTVKWKKICCIHVLYTPARGPGLHNILYVDIWLPFCSSARHALRNTMLSMGLYTKLYC